MTSLSDADRAFLASYEEMLTDYEERARLAAQFVEEALALEDYGLHLVTGRAKSLLSVRRKLLLKRYQDPSTELTDLVGVRVICYYSESVDRITGALRESMTADPRHSLDKRAGLLVNERFGYRSV